jgi:HlyD family secretion protein
LKAASSEKGSVQAAAPAPAASNLSSTEKSTDKEEVQGVFVIRNRKAEFVPVQTGITGTTEIEVVSGLQPGDEIVTGSYKVLRTLRPQTTVKVDNAAPKKEDEN